MTTEYLQKYFINPAIEQGISNYIQYRQTGKYNRTCTFEMHIIKSLCVIYGEKSIILPYKIDNEKAFACNLLMYDLKENKMKQFINLMKSYYDYIQNLDNTQVPSNLITEIETILIEMINLRAKKQEFTMDEIKEFEAIFNPIDGDIKTIKRLIGTDDGLIIKTWNIQKMELTNTQINMMSVNPNLLHPEKYAIYGLEFKDIATLSSEKVDEINQKIAETENNLAQFNKKEKHSRKIILSTGNGFVDKLMLLSIIMTEIMIGIVIAAHLGG